MDKPSFRHIQIYNVLKDNLWHNKSEFIRPYSEDSRRLRDCHENGWFDYEDRQIREGGKVLYSEYRILRVYDLFYHLTKLPKPLKVENKQYSFV